MDFGFSSFHMLSLKSDLAFLPSSSTFSYHSATFNFFLTFTFNLCLAFVINFTYHFAAFNLLLLNFLLISAFV